MTSPPPSATTPDPAETTPSTSTPDASPSATATASFRSAIHNVLQSILPGLQSARYYYTLPSNAPSPSTMDGRGLFRLALRRAIGPHTQCFPAYGDDRSWRSVSAAVPCAAAALAGGVWFCRGDGGDGGGAPLGPLHLSELADLCAEGSEEAEPWAWARRMVYRSDEVGGALGWRRICEMEDLLTGLVLILYPGTGDSGAARAATGADPREGEIASQMVYAGSPDEDDDERRDEESQQQKDLTELLQMSENDGAPRPDDDKEEEKEEGDGKEEQHQYESDNGTMYLRDPLTGDWIDANDLPPELVRRYQRKQNKTKTAPKKEADAPPSKKRKTRPGGGRGKFAAKKARGWIYIGGLPLAATEEGIAAHFSRAGILEIDPADQRPRVKIYRDDRGIAQGNARLKYAREESVQVAVAVLDGAALVWPPDADPADETFRYALTVEPAKFEQRGEYKKAEKPKVSEAARKVARLAAAQAVGWDEGTNGRIAGGAKGLRIVVLKHAFDAEELREGTPKMGNREPPKKKDAGSEEEEEEADAAALARVEKDIFERCGAYGSVEKITVFTKHPDGVAVVKFATPNAASDCVRGLHGAPVSDERDLSIEATFWDGVTDYTMPVDLEKKEEEEKGRLDKFGDWLESQEDLPEELRLRIEQ